METKDYLSIVISVSAFLLSLIATVISLRRKSYEEERAARAQLNDTIGKIIAARIEQAKYASDHPDGGQNFAAYAVLETLNYQINSFARLAVYIAERVPHLASDIEYATIAGAFGWTGDQSKALQYWNAAIDNSKDRHYEILNRRSLANYLFTIGDLGAGREQYKSALALTPVKDDYSKYMSGYTYRMWGVDESQAGNMKSGSDNFDLAEEAYKTISIENLKKNALSDLEKVRQFDGRAGAAIKPGALPRELTLSEIAQAARAANLAHTRDVEK